MGQACWHVGGGKGNKAESYKLVLRVRLSRAWPWSLNFSLWAVGIHVRILSGRWHPQTVLPEDKYVAVDRVFLLEENTVQGKSLSLLK